MVLARLALRAGVAPDLIPGGVVARGACGGRLAGLWTGTGGCVRVRLAQEYVLGWENQNGPWSGSLPKRDDEGGRRRGPDEGRARWVERG